MPELKVLVDHKDVVLDVDTKDDLSIVASILEEKGYPIKAGFPTIMVDGKTVSEWDKVNFSLVYHFGEQYRVVRNIHTILIVMYFQLQTIHHQTQSFLKINLH